MNWRYTIVRFVEKLVGYKRPAQLDDIAYVQGNGWHVYKSDSREEAITEAVNYIVKKKLFRLNTSRQMTANGAVFHSTVEFKIIKP